MKRIHLLLFLTFVFTFGIFFIRSYFLWSGEDFHIEHVEEEYIEPVLDNQKEGSDPIILQEKENTLKKKLRMKFSQRADIDFYYFPGSFERSVSEYKKALASFLESDFIQYKIFTLRVNMYSKMFDVRGKMKDKALNLFGILQMEKDEFLAVGIHEFAHYIDLYFLKKSVLKDVSDYFYMISWDGTKVMRPGSNQKDFVSGYAMTNKYEDFAESFTYYILHNKDFLEKSQNSLLLKQKYDFFTQNLFKQEEFLHTDFSPDNEVQNYYRDTTKIQFELEKLLIFLEKGI